MGGIIRSRGNQSYPISGAVIETFNILYTNVILVLLKAPRRTVLVFLFVSIYVSTFTINKLYCSLDISPTFIQGRFWH